MSGRMSIGETIAKGTQSFFRLRTEPAGPIDASLHGIPFDTGTTYRPGARFGPYSVRKASALLGSVDHAGRDIFERLSVHDGGNMVAAPFDIHAAHAAMEAQAQVIFNANAPALFVGGDHSCTFPLLKAASAKFGKLAVIHFDAHSDTSSPDSWASPVHHGTVFRNAAEAGCIDGNKFIQVGLRGPYGQTDPHGFTRSIGGTIFEAEAMHEAIEHLGALGSFWAETPVYVSIDIDVIDPAYAPGTGTPVAGGITPRELFRAIRSLAPLRIVGFDVMEVAPDYDNAEITSLLAAHLVFEGLSAIAARTGSARVS